MGAAYYIVLDKKAPGADVSVDGKSVARAREAINTITDRLGLRGIDDLTSFGDLLEELGEDVDADGPAPEEVWLDAAEGLAWVAAVRDAVRADPAAVPSPDRVLADLDGYERVLAHAAEIGARWHFAMDV